MFGTISQKLPKQTQGYGAQLYQSSAFVVPNGAFTSVQFNTINRDDFRTLDLVARNTKIVIPSEGWYYIVAYSGDGGWSGSGTSARVVAIAINGSIIAFHAKGAGDGDAPSYNTVADLLYCREQDYVEMQAFQNSGGNLSLLANATLTAIKLN